MRRFTVNRVLLTAVGFCAAWSWSFSAGAGPRRHRRTGAKAPVARRATGSFESLARRAQAVTDLEQVIGPFVQVCGKTGSLRDVQCRAIRRRMQRKVVGKLYAYEVRAVRVGRYDGVHLTFPIDVMGCLTCKDPIKLKWGLYGGKKHWYVTTSVPGSIQHKAGHVLQWKGLVLKQHLGRGQAHLTVAVGPSETEKWTHSTQPNLRVQFLFTVSGDRWPNRLGNGMVVHLRGYRLFDQCNGRILASVPASTGLAPKHANQTCRGPVAPVVAQQSHRKIIPEEPAAHVIRSVMASANPAIRECYDTYQIQGLAQVKVRVKNDGTVTRAVVQGKFAGTPTGKCILDKVRNLIFPRFKRSEIQFVYPFYLR
ncbi:MAG: AgmX/PglI C-terminal domain-containing protein [Deltaproteobacteria bacterium]|nr:AgmX/PglI C-terminal domain-containing protein [Deltaproteobacteria bacterium]